ncbi:MAG: hypothetical protein EBR68_02735 [Synechococcaceae bacterium WB4_2_0811]|nr:hypothetical protein [Synechococcaceae bacterium WB4_2_0811]
MWLAPQPWCCHRSSFTVIGDTVNLASRLESLTRVLDAPVLINQRTAELMQPQIEAQDLGQHSIKGMGDMAVFKPN